MNVTVNRAEFQKALASCAAVVNKKALPILQCVLLTASEDYFSVAVTDLDITLLRAIPPGERTIHDSGRVAINLETLHDFVRNAPDDSIALEVKQEGRLSVSSGNANFALPTISADDFPTIPSCGESNERTAAVDMAILASGYGTVLCASGDGVQTAQSGAVMPKGALIRAANGLLEFCATDGTRLAHASIAIGESATIADVTPVKAARMIIKLGDGGPCLISELTNHVFVGCESYKLSYRRQNVSFPDFTNIVSRLGDGVVVLERARFVDALRRVLLLTPSDNGVILRKAGSLLNLTPMMSERGEGTDAIPCDGAGDLNVNLSGRYLLQALESIEAERVSLGVESSQMVTIKSAGDDEAAIQSVHCLATRVLTKG